MKEYELHVSVSYVTDGGSKQYDSYLEYVNANTMRDAKKIVRDQFRACGIKILSMEVYAV